jgi:uncharacterized membrane protein
MRRGNRTVALAALLGATMALASCGSNHAAATDPCPQDLPTSCPPNSPSYQADVAPILAARCTTCHSPGGAGSPFDFTTYASVFADRSPMLNQVYACNMPPKGAAGLGQAERQMLLAWLVCGAPND